MARFQVFVNRLNLSDPSLSQADINESIYMLKAIGILKQGNVKEELLVQVNQEKKDNTSSESSMYAQALDNMNKAWWK